MSQLLSLDKEGNVAAPFAIEDSDRGPRMRLPGVINEALALPALVPALSNGLVELADRYVSPGLAERVGTMDTPQFAEEASARQEALGAKINADAGLSEPEGFLQNLEEAGGTMLGQIPLLPAKGVKTASELIKANPVRAIAEYLGPTVDGKASSYLTGAVAGGALGTLGDGEEPRAPSPDDELSFRELVRRYSASDPQRLNPHVPAMAGGGKISKVRGLKNVLKMLDDEGFKGDYGDNSSSYLDAIDHPGFVYPAVGTDDFERLADMSEWVDHVSDNDLNKLFSKYAIDVKPSTPLHRGIYYGDTVEDLYKLFPDRGNVTIGPHALSSASTSRGQADDFAQSAPYLAKHRPTEVPGGVSFTINRDKLMRALPNLLSGQDELLLPSSGYTIPDSYEQLLGSARGTFAKKANGGKVGTLLRIKNEKGKRFADRGVRLLDEEPLFRKYLSDEGLYKLAGTEYPIALLDQGEFNDLANPFPKQQGVTYHNINNNDGLGPWLKQKRPFQVLDSPSEDMTSMLDLATSMGAHGRGLREPPFLHMSFGDPSLGDLPTDVRVVGHNGRHRSGALGFLLDDIVKTPTHIIDEAGAPFEPSYNLDPHPNSPYFGLDHEEFLQAMLDKLKGVDEVIPESHKLRSTLGNPKRLPWRKDRAFSQGGLLGENGAQAATR
jgi:hypothetical protein